MSLPSWEETIRVVPRGDGKTVDIFKGDELRMTVQFPQWPPTREQVEKLHEAMMKHVTDSDLGGN